MFHKWICYVSDDSWIIAYLSFKCRSSPIFLSAPPHQFLTMPHMFSIISEVHLMSVTFGQSRRALTFLNLLDIKFEMSKYVLYLEWCALSIFLIFCSSSSNCHHAMAQGLKGGKSLNESTRNQRPQSRGKDAFLQCLHQTCFERVCFLVLFCMCF